MTNSTSSSPAAATYMRAEIFEQPETLQRLIEHAPAVLAPVAEAAARSTFAMLAARGSSDNASTYGKYLLESLCGLPTALAAPSLYTLYHLPPRLANSLVIGVSQSGAAADVIAVLDAGRKQGATTLAITNTAGSPMAQAAKHVLLLDAGLEKALAATKTVTGQCAAYACLAAAISKRDDLLAQLRELPNAVTDILARTDAIAAVAQSYRHTNAVWVIGRGYAYSAAEEIALKLKETCFIHAEAFSAADFLHGPLATIEPGDDVMVLLSQDETLPTTLQFVERVLTRGARVLLVAPKDVLAMADVSAVSSGNSAGSVISMALPPMPPLVSNIGFIVAGQLFAMHLSLAKGHNPDVSRGVTKVTVTR